MISLYFSFCEKKLTTMCGERHSQEALAAFPILLVA